MAWDSLSFYAKIKIYNEWNVVLIVANCMHIIHSLDLIGPIEFEEVKNSSKMGIAVMLLWFSLPKYLAFSDNYSHLTNVFLGSASAISKGMIGILPIIIGASYFATT
jgi:hypothetical protein